MYKQDYLEVFINDADRVTIQCGNPVDPTVISIAPRDLINLTDALNSARHELIESNILGED